MTQILLPHTETKKKLHVEKLKKLLDHEVKLKTAQPSICIDIERGLFGQIKRGEEGYRI